ncbi:hypothetical protein A0H81_11253 [Grifola frondosa]|uniref:Uncharacterized protein n=1 Tax=Grifola frondosa TaxID=5627 RepID=A0A1C7LX91_GRIFR|nr:hypothetical protein A0H81_11253 [Grifola frondosa]
MWRRPLPQHLEGFPRSEPVCHSSVVSSVCRNNCYWPIIVSFPDRRPPYDLIQHLPVFSIHPDAHLDRQKVAQRWQNDGLIPLRVGVRRDLIG